MNERKCLWCNRKQSEHPGMTFASQDRWCRCSICLTGKQSQGSTTTGTPVQAFARVRRLVRQHGKDNRD